MDDERPPLNELTHRNAGVAEPKHVRLSRHPIPHYRKPREEAGREAFPPAIIQGPFRPIRDRGPETPVVPHTPRHRREYDR
jgi:hypothetical protein